MVDVQNGPALSKRRHSLSEVHQPYSSLWLHSNKSQHIPLASFAGETNLIEQKVRPCVDLIRCSDRAMVRIMLDPATPARSLPTRLAWPPSRYEPHRVGCKQPSSIFWRDQENHSWQQWATIPRLNAPHQQPAVVFTGLGQPLKSKQAKDIAKSFRDTGCYEGLRERGQIVHYDRQTHQAAFSTIDKNRWLIGPNLVCDMPKGSNSKPLLHSNAKGDFHIATLLGAAPIVCLATVIRVGDPRSKQARETRDAAPMQICEDGRRINGEREIRREYNWSFALGSPFAPISVIQAGENRVVISPVGHNDARSAVELFEESLRLGSFKAPIWLEDAAKNRSFSPLQLLRHLAACHCLGQVALQLEKLWQLRWETDSHYDRACDPEGDRHVKNGVHGDIKLDNLLVDNDFNVWLNDFGYTRNFQGARSERHGSPAYMAPEILTLRAYDGRPVDAWALGFAVVQILLPQETDPHRLGLPLDWTPIRKNLHDLGKQQDKVQEERDWWRSIGQRAKEFTKQWSDTHPQLQNWCQDEKKRLAELKKGNNPGPQKSVASAVKTVHASVNLHEFNRIVELDNALGHGPKWLSFLLKLWDPAPNNRLKPQGIVAELNAILLEGPHAALPEHLKGVLADLKQAMSQRPGQKLPKAPEEAETPRYQGDLLDQLKSILSHGVHAGLLEQLKTALRQGPHAALPGEIRNIFSDHRYDELPQIVSAWRAAALLLRAPGVLYRAAGQQSKNMFQDEASILRHSYFPPQPACDPLPKVQPQPYQGGLSPRRHLTLLPKYEHSSFKGGHISMSSSCTDSGAASTGGYASGSTAATSFRNSCYSPCPKEESLPLP